MDIEQACHPGLINRKAQMRLGPLFLKVKNGHCAKGQIKLPEMAPNKLSLMGHFTCIKAVMCLFNREKLYHASTYPKLRTKRKINCLFLDNADKIKCN